MSAGDWERLGRLVDAERGRRGWSKRQLVAAVGVGKTTIDSIIHARKQSYDQTTVAGIERAFEWKPGSVDRILRGSDPQPIEDPDLVALRDLWPRLSPETRRTLLIIAREAVRARRD